MKRKLSSIFHQVIFISLLTGSYQSDAESIKVYEKITDKETGGAIPEATVLFISGNADTTRTITNTTGNYEVLLDMLSTSVDESPRPETFLLRQNYPNPFNPATVIEYQIQQAGHVHLTVYNIMGQKIRQLVNGYQNAGMQRITWNGADDNGNGVAAGVYLYQLNMGGQSVIRKMLLLDGGIVQYSRSQVGTVSSPAGKAVAACSYTYSMNINKEWYTPYLQNIELQGTEKEIRNDFVLSSVNFFPLYPGNGWHYRKLNIETQTVLSEESWLTIPDTVTIDGRKYFHMVQTWNSLLPDTLSVRQEGFLMYWYLGGKDNLVCDFKAPVDSSWTVSLPSHGNNEAQTLLIQKVQLDSSPLYQRQYLKFSIAGKNIFWYEQYVANEGIFLIHDVNLKPDMTETYVLEDLFLGGGGVAIDYDYPSLFRHLNALFGK